MHRKQTTLPEIDWLRCLILALGAVLLFLFLDWKPAQHDEGVNGWMIQDLITKGYYAYDPANYHGPLHFYLLFVFKVLLGDNLWALRMSAVLFGLGSLYLMTAMKPYVGRFVAYGAALLAAVSPGMTFYSRYAIHESGLLFFSLLMLLGFFRYRAHKDLKAVIFLSAGFTGMLVMKETLIIHLVVFFIAFKVTQLYEKISPSEAPLVVSAEPSFRAKEVWQVIGVSALVVVTLYSGFFLNWEGISGIFKSFGEWANTGALPTSEQKGHWKPLTYWIQLFLKHEWPAALGFLLCFPLLASCPRWHRLLMVYSLGIFAAYSLIPYKTPWCILQIIWPFLFVTAAGLSALASLGSRGRVTAILVLLILSAVSLQKTVQLNFFRYADEKELYPHVQTFEDLMMVDRKLKEFVREYPLKKHISIHVVKKAYWPISWLLLDFTRQAYYTEEYPSKGDADLIFCDGDRRSRMEMRLKNSYFIGHFRLNPSQDPSVVYYDTRTFAPMFGPDAERFDPPPQAAARPGEGLKLHFYNNAEWSGDAVKEEIAAGIDHAWDDTDRPLDPPFGLIFEGELLIPKEGEYSFYLASDDGSEFYFDGQRLIDNGGNHADLIKSVTKNFSEGWHPVKVRFYDAGGGASVRLWWKQPGGKEEKIESRFFRPGEV